MDITAALTQNEIAALSNPDSPCEDAGRQLRNADATKDAAAVSIFEESLRAKNTLDAYEDKGMREVGRLRKTPGADHCWNSQICSLMGSALHSSQLRIQTLCAQPNHAAPQ